MIKIQKLKTIRKPISSKAEIVLLGLTPGRQQHQAFNNLKNPRHGAFKGQMRTRLYNYFKFLGIVKHYNLVDKDGNLPEN